MKTTNPNHRVGCPQDPDTLKLSRAMFLHVLGAIVALSLRPAASAAQPFFYPSSNPEYKSTRLYEVTDGAQFSSTDPGLDLTMECLAANGYGQWTVSSSVGSHSAISGHPWRISTNNSYSNSAGWFLLANYLGKPSERFASSDPTHHPGCQPPGIVSGGAFNGAYPIITSKAAANLVGSVYFVSVDLTTPMSGTTFNIQALSDVRGPSGQQQIDISMPSLPNPQDNRQVVKADINPILGVSAGVNPVDNSETDFRDEFDCASDAHYLYIVWRSGNSIYATVLDESSNSVVSGYPITVSAVGENAKRPTVACDVRNNSTGTPTPGFCVAYIKANNGGSASVKVLKYIGTIAANTVTLQQSFHNPFSNLNPDISYGKAMHARVLVSSVAGSGSPVVSVYVIAGHGGTSPTTYDLLYYNPLSFGIDIGWYVDGVMDNLPSINPAAICSLLNPSASVTGVKDVHLVAFANPYDNQTGVYNQFHCLYQLIMPNPGIPINPLLMVRGDDNNFGNCGSPDSRLFLSRGNSGLTNDPTWVVGAVNQMGIHVHWRTASNEHFYARDERAFDEDIEENTLATGLLRLENGTSHGGTIGAKLQGHRQLTLWSDPNYGYDPSDANSGLYLETPLATTLPVDFNGFGTTQFNFNRGIITEAVLGSSTLTIGGTGSSDQNAHFYSLPDIDLPFLITVNRGSTWDYFGGPPYFDGSNIDLEGVSGNMAKLNLHGGTNLFTTLTSEYGDIEVLYDENVSPASSSTNTNETGLLSLNGNDMLVEHSVLNSYIPADNTKVICKILRSGSGGHTGDITLTANSNDYSNLDDGFGIIQYNDASNGGKAPDRVTLNGGTVNRLQFHAYDPVTETLTLTNLTFNHTSDREVFIERATPNTEDYAGVNVTNNTFNDNVGWDLTGNAQYGIYLYNFNKSGQESHLNVSSNHFEYTNYYTTMSDAIAFENSTGNIVGNIITDWGYLVGIHNFSTAISGVVPVTSSYICGNTIENSGPYVLVSQSTIGIETDYYHGYCKLNTISTPSWGLQAGVNGKPMLAFTSITDCYRSGILTTDGTAIVDLTGVHGASADDGVDIAGFNNIQDNCQSLSQGQVLLNNSSLILYGKQVSWWTSWGNNNTIATTPIPTRSSALSPLLLAMSSGSTTIGDINDNYWESQGDVLDPTVADHVHWDPIVTSDVNCDANITYTTPTIVDGSASTVPEGTSCSGGFATAHPKGKSNNRSLASTPPDSCTHLREWMFGSRGSIDQYKQQYDTLRRYVESCAVLDSDWSYRAFSSTTEAVQYFAQNDTAQYDQYRDWLISVLFLCPKKAYYCADVIAIASVIGAGKYHEVPNAALAVFKFLLDCPDCKTPGLEATYDTTINRRHEIWLSGDRKTPEDTTLPSLDSIGLGILLNPPSLVPLPGSFGTQYLASLTGSPNPFVKETELTFVLNRMTYVTLAIYDELGRMVWGDGKGHSLDEGIHTIHIDGTSLPSGTLYARISTGFGEVKTVKLVHQE